MTIITTEQQVSLTLSALTAAGNPATGELNGSPLWSSSNVGIVSLVVASNGLSAVASATGPGTATITVTANAGTTSSPVSISTSTQIQVIAAPAASLVLTVGTPVVG